MRIREAYTLGQIKKFDVRGNYLRVRNATGATAGSVDIRFWKAGQSLNIDLIAVDPGDWAKIPDGFDQIEVISSVAQTIDLHVARGEVGSNFAVGSVTIPGVVSVAGVVSVISGELTRSLSADAFWSWNSCGAVAAQFSHLQLWNPAASGFNLVVDEMYAQVTAVGQNVIVRRYSTALGTLNATVPNPKSKLLGGVASVAEQRGTNNVAILALLWTSIPSYQRIKMIEPIIIPPNDGLLIVNGVVNDMLTVDIQFFEVPV